MALMVTNLLEFQEEPTQKQDILRQTPYINGGHPNAVRPLENLRNRYYAQSSIIDGTPSQSLMIARTNPPVKAKTKPVTLSATGFGGTYRLSDEALRQYSLGTYLQNMRGTYYQTRP